MRSKRSKEGYVLIDHRNSPGISQEFLQKNYLVGPAVEGGQTFESAMYNCCGCGADVILNPDRSRPREWCWSCDSYMCDGCTFLKKSGKPHVPLARKYAEHFDKLHNHVKEI